MSDWILKTIQALLDKLPISYSIISAVAVLLFGFSYWLIGETQPTQRALSLRVIAAFLLTALFGLAAWLNHSVFLSTDSPQTKSFGWLGLVLATAGAASLFLCFALHEPPFPDNVTGILVLKISGDPENATQFDLVGQLNSELGKEGPDAGIEVRGGRVAIAEEGGLPAAHKRARAIGESHNAILVVWGMKTAGDKFYPRITIVNPGVRAIAESERTYEVQSIGDVKLPEELLDAPFYVIDFAAGFAAYERGDFRRAQTFFEKALQRVGALPTELGDLQSYAGLSSLLLCDYDVDYANNAAKAVRLFEDASRNYLNRDRKKWAITQGNLAAAYSADQSGSRAEHLHKAISSCEAALTVLTEHESPDLWATAQWNLGIAYGDLWIGDRKQNLEKALIAFDSAGRVRTKNKDAIRWARLKNCMGIATRKLNDAGVGDRNSNAAKAISYFQEALTVEGEADHSFEWALTQRNLGNAYGDFDPPKFDAAQECYLSALRVLTRVRTPTQWAITQVNLAKLYVAEGKTKSEKKLVETAVSVYDAALEVLDERTMQNLWGITQKNLGVAYYTLFKVFGDEEKGLLAIESFNMALRVIKENEFAEDWKFIQVRLGGMYSELRSGDSASNLRNAVSCFVAAERVATKVAKPTEWAKIETALGWTYEKFIQLDPVRYLPQSKAHYEAALEVFNERDFPVYHRSVAEALDRVNHLSFEVPPE